MPLILAAAVVFTMFVWLGRRGKDGRRRDWRAASAVLSIAAVAGAVFALAKGAWPLAILLGAAAFWLGADFRRRGTGAGPKIFRSGVGVAEARSILGVGADAGPEEINAAYMRLMRTVHPDVGGTSGLAAQLNAARDVLLKKT